MTAASEKLLRQSSLTKRQIESLLSYLRVTSGDIKLREAASQTSKGAITIGSYYRTVGQARKNVREALATVLIGLQLGLLRVEDVRRLFEMVGVGNRELSEEEQDRFAEVLQVLLDRIVL